MLERCQLHPKEVVFNYLADDGKSYHFAVERIARAIHTHRVYYPDQYVPTKVRIEPDYAMQIPSTRGIEKHRLERICGPIHQPVIYVKWPTGRTHLLIDGNHRYFRAFQRGDADIWAYMLPFEFCQPYLCDLGPINKEEILRTHSGL